MNKIELTDQGSERVLTKQEIDSITKKQQNLEIQIKNTDYLIYHKIAKELEKIRNKQSDKLNKLKFISKKSQ